MFDFVRTANNICFHCGHKLDAATGLTTARPTEGSISICVECGAVAIYNDQGEIRLPTNEEQAEINQDEAISAIIAKARRLIAAHKHKRRG